MEQSKIDRINELYRKSKNGVLSDAEKAEQAQLRREYIESYKRSLICELENTYIIDKNGHKRKVTRKVKKK